MAHNPIQLTPLLYDYYQKVGYREPPILANLRAHFQNHAQLHQHTMEETAQMLALLVQLVSPNQILEIGTFIGYSTLAMALVMPRNCSIMTCDKDESLIQEARLFWEKAQQETNITFMPGDALKTLQDLRKIGHRFQFVYIDANKKAYMDYYEEAIGVTLRGGLIVLDNTLSAGRVVDTSPPPYVESIKALNAHIHQDSRVDMVLIPMGDGLTCVRKK